MSGQTPYFGLSYFDFGDRLDSGINVRKEIDRFLLIDKQLYGLYSIFGDGVINGWDVTSISSTSQQSIQVSISSGMGIVQSISLQTSFSEIVDNLPANSVVYIFALTIGNSISTRDVQFIWSRNFPGTQAVRLARVTTGDNSVLSIDSSYRDEIGFLRIIQSEIAKHKHRGSPSKIDLRQETRNQLPGARLEDFDASKIVSGRFDTDRIPQLDHNNLDNNGLLTHAQLDSFVRNITSGNRQLLGEVGMTNLLKLMLSWKYANPTLDTEFVNSFSLIPGLTKNGLIDFDASTSNIDLTSRCISGKPNAIGQIRSIIWNSTSSFSTASDRNLVTIALDEVSLTRGANSSTFIENFESVPAGNVKIPGFSADTQVIDDHLEVVSDPNDAFRTEGFYSGKFKTDRNFRALYTRTITANKDWSAYDELVLDVKSLSLTHGPVYMYFVNGTGDTATQSQTYILLGPDEITSNPDQSANGFERRSFSIIDETRDNITQLVIYTDDIVTKQVFWIDNIFLRNQALFPPTGFIRFRFTSGVNITFRSLIFETDIPDGCNVRARIRTANSTDLLNRSVFGPLLNSGDIIGKQGTDAEIDIALFSNDARNKTPLLKYLELQIEVNSEEVGFSIDTADQWSRGTYVNSELKLDESRLVSKVVIADPVAVGDIYYSFKNVVSDIDPSLVAVYGFQASSFMLSPKQALNFFDNQGAKGFKYPFSVYRLANANFLIADMDNDRVLEFEPNGSFVRGIGSHNAIDSAFFYPMSVVYNPRTGILTTAFSQEVDVSSIDIRKVVLWIGGSPLALGSSDTIPDSTKTKKLLEISLSADKQAQLFNSSSQITVQYLNGMFPTAFTYSQSAQQIIGNRGLSLYIGDFVYIDGISHPVFANVLENTHWIICNSSVNFDETAAVSGTSIGLYSVEVGADFSFTVQVDAPKDGYYVQWRIVVPTELTSFVSWSTPPPGNITTVNVTSPTNAVIGQWRLTFIAEYRNIQTQEVTSSTQNQALLSIVAPATPGSGTPTVADAPSILEINMATTEVAFSFSKISFSDFSLGSVYELDSETFLIAGMTTLQDTLVPPVPTPPGTVETFAQQAARKLLNYRGKVIVLDRTSKAVRFEYDCPDGSYASDAVLDDENNYVIAETTFASNNGRIVKIDSFGNIIAQVAGGNFSKINDVRALNNGNVFIST